MSSIPPSAETAGREGSRLCLACGLCCQGVLHRGAHIEHDEIETVRRLGLTVIASEEGPVFPLPCHLHQEGRCTVYTERPNVCHSYQCKLLRRYLTGEVGWDDCMRLIDLAKDLMTQISRRGPADLETLVDTAALAIHCKKNFLNRAQPKVVLGP